jgi:hypothetical protein
MIKIYSHSYWWFFTIKRKEQNNIKLIKFIRTFIKKYIVTHMIIMFFAMFNNFILYFMMIYFGFIGGLELVILLNAIITQNYLYFKYKINKKLIW